MKFKLLQGRKREAGISKVVPLVQIVDVKCSKCRREFRTVPAVVRHAGKLFCPTCGLLMEISEPQPVSVLARAKGSNAA